MPKKRPVVAPKVVRYRSRRVLHGRAGQQRAGQRFWPASTSQVPMTSTTERDLADWVSWFARFHADPLGLYVPYDLRMLDCCVEADGQPAAVHRCVREVAKFNGVAGIEWMLITWVPGLPGAQFQRWPSLDDAARAIAAPAATVRFHAPASEATPFSPPAL